MSVDFFSVGRVELGDEAIFEADTIRNNFKWSMRKYGRD